MAAMFGGQIAAIESYLGWWADAGLVDPVSDDPRDWLARVAPPVVDQRASAAPVPALVAEVVERPAPAPTAPMPDDLAGFDAWLAGDPSLPGAHWSMARVLPEGGEGAPMMILADGPDVADLEMGRLFSGSPGRLLDAMLAAIGLARGDIRLASIALTRAPGGRIDGAEAEALVRIARHHIHVARPQRLLIVGQQAAQLIAATDGGGNWVGDVPRQRAINHYGATIDAYAIHHPRLLIERPMLKRAAWAVLKTFRPVPTERD